MLKKTAYALLALAVLATGAKLVSLYVNGEPPPEYELAEIVRGDLQNTISCSGTISALGTVEVGTQVSGAIARVYVDFNDLVQKGQLLAVLDTVMLQASLLDAEAGLDRARAQLTLAEASLNRNLPLRERGLISEADFLPVQLEVDIQETSVKSADAALRRAEHNLQYAFIRSPIDGTVIHRNVEAGQTVAASLSTPTLFTIAEDLARMEILAEVDESDIGQIEEGMAARFDVQAYPDQAFEGTVTQVRALPQTISNVVNYTVVVDAANDEKLLLPGMTATVDFVIESREGVLLVPNRALRFQPSEEQIAAFRARRQTERKSRPDSLRGKGSRSGERPDGGRASNGSDGMASGMGRIWYINEEGQLEMAALRAGATDGANTVILRSRNLSAGSQVICGSASSSSTSTADQRGPGFGMGRPF